VIVVNGFATKDSSSALSFLVATCNIDNRVVVFLSLFLLVFAQCHFLKWQ
jgi:hypothetical protein